MAKKLEGKKEGGYKAIWDSRFYVLGGEEAGYKGEDFISYEIESEENYSCGQTLTFQEQQLTICTKSCRSEGAELLFTYRLAQPQWAGEKRLMNEGLCGLSLLGKVVSREGERLKLRLDIDRQHPDRTRENAYPFSWRPPTGNLMYMMPEEGSQVSLYFPSGEEEGAMAVNCILKKGEAKEGHYTERGLKAQGKELKLYPDCMGLESPTARVLLDGEEGLCISGEKPLVIGAKAGISIVGEEILLDGGEESLHFYRGSIEKEPEKEPVLIRKAEFHLLKKSDTLMTVSLAEATCLAAYRHERYEAERFRFSDDPLQERYNHLALFGRVMGGIAVVGLFAIGAGAAAGLAGVGGAGVKAVMGAAALTGAATVLGQRLEDSLQGQISSAEDYLRAALKGSVIGALTGAVNVALPKGISVAGHRLMDFCGGGAEEGLWQLMDREELSLERMVGAGAFSVMGGEFVRRIALGLSEGRLPTLAEEMVEEGDWYVKSREAGGSGGLADALDLSRIDYAAAWDGEGQRNGIEGGSGSKFQEVFDLADNYTLSDDTFNNHILDRHGPNSTYGNKSHFNADFDIRNGIDSTLTGDNFIVGPNTAGREGYIFEQTFTNPIGTNSKGKPLYTLKVVIDEAGNIITAFPKK